jgi:hypothetical protein
MIASTEEIEVINVRSPSKYAPVFMEVGTTNASDPLGFRAERLAIKKRAKMLGRPEMTGAYFARISEEALN